MIEAVKTLPVAKKAGISEKEGAGIMLEQYDLEKLQAAICIYFYYHEFMENVREVFKEAQAASTLDINE